MSPKPLSWQSALSASVVIHALLVGGIGLIFFQSAPVGGSGMLTVDLGGPAGNAGGLGDMHQDGRLGNGGAGGDGAKSHSKDRRLEPTDEPEKPLAPKTEGETLDEPPKAAAAETSLDSKPTPKAPELTSTQPTADSGDEQVKSAQAKPILKRQNPQPQVSKNIKPVSKPKSPHRLKKKLPLPKRMAKTARLSMSAQAPAVQLERAERLTAKLRPKDPEWGMGKERLSAAAISLRTVTAPIRHWVPAASRTKSFQRQRQGIRGQLVPLASTRSYGCG